MVYTVNYQLNCLLFVYLFQMRFSKAPYSKIQIYQIVFYYHGCFLNFEFNWYYTTIFAFPFFINMMVIMEKLICLSLAVKVCLFVCVKQVVIVIVDFFCWVLNTLIPFRLDNLNVFCLNLVNYVILSIKVTIWDLDYFTLQADYNDK